MSVTAVLVAAAEGYLPLTLSALKNQELQPERIILIDARPQSADGSLEDALERAGLDTPAEVIEARGAENFGRAINEALAPASIDTEWMWLLHDDSPPMPDALSEQVRATASARLVGIAGAKQVGIDDPDRLLSVGVTYTRAGRRLPEIEPGEIDQGQYDAREDVFAVGTAGMLIRTATWEAMGGTDPALGPFLDGAELSRRVRLAGERVIVVPTAKVRHACASLWHGPDRAADVADGSHSFLARRIAILHYRLVTAHPAWLLFVTISMVIGGVLRALRRVASNDLRAAWEELIAPFMTLRRANDIRRSRRRAAKTSVVARGALRPLQASRLDIGRGWVHRWRVQRVDQRRKLAPSELEIEERRIISRRRRVMLSAVTFALLGLGAMGIVRIFSGGGSLKTPLFGGALRGLDQDYVDIFTRFFSGWMVVGDGAPVPEHPFAGVLATLATLVGGPLGVPTSVVAGVLLGFGIPLAGLSAWFAAGGIARSVAIRAWAALAWAIVPVFSQALAQGRLSAILAHILLPLFGLALARAYGVDRRDVIRSGLESIEEEQRRRRVPALSSPSGAPSLGAAGAAGLLLAAIAASAPLIAPALIIIAILPAIITRSGALRVLVTLAPVVVLFLPHVAYGGRHGWARIFESVEEAPIALIEFTDHEAPWWELLPWQRLIGFVDTPLNIVLPAAVAGFLALLAVIGLISPRVHGARARWGVLVAALGVAVTIGAGFVIGSPQYDWLGSLQRLPQWAGPGVSVATIGMLIAATAGAVRIASLHRSRPNFGRRVALGLSAAGLAATLGLGGTAVVLETGEDPLWSKRDVQPLPALARQTVSSIDRSRVLVMAPSELALFADIWRSNGPQFLDQSLDVDHTEAARSDLTSLAAEIYAGNGTNVGQRLAAHGIGFILVPSLESMLVDQDELAHEELIVSLDALGVLERVTQNDSGTLWRVVVPSARVTIVQPEGTTVVPSGLTEVTAMLPELPSTSAGTVELAERADPHWRATLDGRSLRVVTPSWHQTFELPAGASGELQIVYRPVTHRLWQIAFAAIMGFTAVLAIPLRRGPEVVR